MRSIARQSARLATRSRSRQVGSRRTIESCSQRRTFHQSAQRAEPRSPNNQTGQHDLSNERKEPHKAAESANTEHNEATEQDSAETKSGNDMRKHGMRRTLRQKRMHDVPKPPPIPEWFLQHNVTLYKDSPGLNVSKDSGRIVRCIDAETGHTLFTVPYYEAWPHNKDIKGREAPKGSAKDYRAYMDEDKAASQKTESQAGSTLGQDFFDHKYNATKTPTTEQKTVGRTSHIAEMRVSKPTSEAESNTNPLRWAFLEAETGVRAAFFLASQNQHSSSFATDRLDLSFQCADLNSHEQLDEFVQDIAKIVEADVIRLDANDFSELAEDYVGQGHDEPGSYSTLAYDIFDGHTAHSGNRFRRPSRQIDEENDEDEVDEDEEADEESESPRSTNLGHFSSFEDLRKALQSGRTQIGNAIRAQIVGIGFSPSGGQNISALQRSLKSSSSEPRDSEWNRDDARLAVLLDHLLDAPKQKLTSAQLNRNDESQRRPFGKVVRANEIDTSNQDKSIQRYRRYWRSNPAFWMPTTAGTLVSLLNETIRKAETGTPAITLSGETRSASSMSNSSATERTQQRTIVHVRDLRDISNSPLGHSIINRLVKAVRKRRRAGEQIVIVGTTAQDVPGPFNLPGERSDDQFRSINLSPFFNLTIAEDFEFEENHPSVSPSALDDKSLSDPAHRRILDINLRHIQKMLRRLRPDYNIDLLAPEVRGQLYMPGMQSIANKVLSLDEVQQYVLLAIGLAQSHAVSDAVKPIHIALAGFVIAKSSLAEQSWQEFKEQQQAKRDPNTNSRTASGKSNEARMDRLRKSCNQHESRLLSGMVNPENIKTAFTDVQAPGETIEALKTLTTLSLLRPDAFKYGVLAEDRLPGLLLYGPPGTGKTLLAKAVAKESRATVLEVTGAQIYEKYVGEGEKMVRAVFSLAKKLSPCVVFIDEADAIFGARSNSGNRNTHREIINQFLREWDGMDSVSNVFMMVASNRPFDLDDAVLRRLPRRLLIDLPVAKEREGILGIHLKNEHLDETVSLSKLAEQTPLYSGSDLKNVAVAAALACVREENELARSHEGEKEFKHPEKRTLSLRHFEKALEEVSASISEDMSSLSAIRKFDEQYGDRKGRTKKKGYGFGVDSGGVDEGAAMVRQPPSASTAPPVPP